MRLHPRVRDAMWSAYVWPKGRVGNRLQGALLDAVESRRVRQRWDEAGRILLVHTPGKVGSKAIVATLASGRRPEDAIFHTHRINPDSLAVAAAERTGLAPRKTWFTAEVIGARLRQPQDKPVVVLSAVRDPVRRALSAFLQNIERYGESGRPLTSHAGIDPQELTRQFVERFPHAVILQWMQVEIEAMFGVDVFGTPFDHDAGFQVLRGPSSTVGILRHDRFQDRLPDFVRTLTQIDVPEVGRINDSSRKVYGDAYAVMLRDMRLPGALLDQLYDSAYARHFFTAAERTEAVERWRA